MIVILIVFFAADNRYGAVCTASNNLDTIVIGTSFENFCRQFSIRIIVLFYFTITAYQNANITQRDE